MSYGEDDYVKRLKTFVRKYQIDGPNTIDFMLCDPQRQEDVMTAFNPPGNTRNINAVFNKFLKSNGEQKVAPHEASGGGVLEDDVVDQIVSFVLEHHLDEAAERCLIDLPPGLQVKAMQKFQPGAGKSSPSAAFMMFAKGLDQNAPGSQPQQQQPQQHARRPFRGDPGQEAAAFVAQWGLDVDAARLLHELPAAAQAEAMSRFTPRADVRNMSAAFIGFVTKRRKDERQQVQVDPVMAFMQHWALDEGAQLMMRNYPWEVQEDIMANFSPPNNINNMSACFAKFANSRHETAKKMFQQNQQAQQWQFQQSNRPPLLPRKRERAEVNALMPKGEAAAGGNVEEFVSNYSLDDSAIELLMRLPEDDRQRVMSTFNPPANTRNYSAVFIAYVMKNSQTGGKGGQGPPKRARQ